MTENGCIGFYQSSIRSYAWSFAIQIQIQAVCYWNSNKYAILQDSLASIRFVVKKIPLKIKQRLQKQLWSHYDTASTRASLQCNV